MQLLTWLTLFILFVASLPQQPKLNGRGQSWTIELEDKMTSTNVGKRCKRIKYHIKQNMAPSDSPFIYLFQNIKAVKK